MSFDGYMQIFFSTIVPAFIAIILESTFSKKENKKKYIICTIGIWVLITLIVTIIYLRTKSNNYEEIQNKSVLENKIVEIGDQSPVFENSDGATVVYNNNYNNYYDKNSETVVVPIPETEQVEPLSDFPFSFNRNMIFSDTLDITIPDSAFEGEKGQFELFIPIDIQEREYQSDKVPLNEDIHGFIVNDTYYCNDSPPKFEIEDDYCLTSTHNEIDLQYFNYYDFGDYWLCLHRVDISFIGTDNFSPDLKGADIVLKEKISQKSVPIGYNYSGGYVSFKCSTGDYIVEVRKNNIAYVQELSVNENIEKRILVITNDDYERLP